MCIDPLTAAAIAGTALSAIGSIQQGRAASAAASFNAQVANNNAVAAEQQAAYDENQQRDRFRRAQASARASLGISGQTGAGSAEDILSENAGNAELDAQAIRYGGAVRAAGLRNQAAMSSFEGAQRANAAYIGAGTNLLLSAARWGAPGASPGRVSVSADPLTAGYGGQVSTRML